MMVVRCRNISSTQCLSQKGRKHRVVEKGERRSFSSSAGLYGGVTVTRPFLIAYCTSSDLGMFRQVE